jgi:phosphoribosylanthranilate isomerase
MVTLVALVVDAQIPELEAIIDQVAPDIIQYHGQESHDFCNAVGHPYWKAIRVKSEQDVALAQQDYPRARALLLDAWVDGVPGGTGRAIDPACMNQAITVPWILAGGLTPDNVSDALLRYRPHAVDVSSGVERSAGVKDAIKLRQFIAAVKSFDEANVL